MKLPISTKGIKFDKSNSNLYLILIVSVVVTIFSLTSTKALLDQASYQRRVINARQATVKQLRANLQDAKSLAEQYTIFNGGTTNVIGGKNSNDPNVLPPDGDNARIILNALPSNYDFPALISSMAKILADDQIGSPSVGGNDQSAQIDSGSQTDTSPTAIPLTIGGTSDYSSIQKLVRDLERSTRPFDITSLQLRGSNDNMTLSLEMNTYFQLAQKLNLSDQEVK